MHSNKINDTNPPYHQGLEYFDLFLVHFPISLQYVDPKDKYPPEWWGLDGGVHPSKSTPPY